MFKQGAKKEVDKFFKLKVKKDMSANKIIGIHEIANYLNNSLSLQATKELIRIRTRQYAKRQFTWARGCLLYTSPSPRDKRQSRMPSSA